MRKTFTAIFASAMVAMPGLVNAETLGDIVKIAVSTHPTVAAREAAQRAREDAVDQERATYFPTIDFTLDYGIRAIENATTRARNPSDRDFRSTSLGEVKVTQMVFDGFDTINRERAAKIRADVAVDEIHDSEETIALRAAQAYLEVLRDRLIVELAEENVKSHTAVRDDMKVKAEGGGNSVADLRQAEARLFQAQARLEELRGTLRDSTTNFLESVGTLPGQLEPPTIPDQSFPKTVEDAVAILDPFVCRTAGWPSRRQSRRQLRG